MTRTILRFAPSPNGELHLGHALSALINFDLARRLDGAFLLRIEDIDVTRCTPEFEAGIYRDLAWLGIEWERSVRRQSEHFPGYRAALDRLIKDGVVYPAFMTRGEIRARIVEHEAAGGKWPRDPDGAPLYPALDKRLTSRQRRDRLDSGKPFAWRLDMDAAIRRAGVWLDSRSLPPPLTPPHKGEGDFAPGFPSPLWGGVRGGGMDSKTDEISYLTWTEFDPNSGTNTLIPATPERWGDVIVARSDIPTSYNLSVVLDDAAQGITHVVRGSDLYEATSVHRVLQTLLDLPAPIYHHHRLVLDPSGRKLSKSERSSGLRALRESGVTPADIRRMLGLPPVS